MAAFPGISLLSNFSFVFTFLFTFSLIFGILEVIPLFGDKKKGINSIIALSLAMMLLFSTKITNIVTFMAPWFVVTIIIVFFIMFIQMMFGVKMEDFRNFATKSQYKNTLAYWTIAIAIITLIFGISLQFGQTAGPYLSNDTASGNSGYTDYTIGNTTVQVGTTNTGNFNQNLGATIFHPKVLGMIAIVMIATFAVRLISTQDK